MRLILLLITCLLGASGASAQGTLVKKDRESLIAALQAEDAAKQMELVAGLVTAQDPLVEQALLAWRQGGIYVFETNGTTIPFMLDPVTDAEGKAKAIQIKDGEFIKDGAGKAIGFVTTELTAVDTSSKLRKVIKSTLDLVSINNPDPNMRRDAVTKLAEDQNQEYLTNFLARLKEEKIPEVRKALSESISVTELASEKPEVRLAAIIKLGEGRSINGLTFLKKLEKEVLATPTKYSPDLPRVLHVSIKQIEDYIAWGNFFGTAFRGVSLSAVLLVVSLGLAITFGLMGIINMAHGEVMMVGAYTAYVTQNIFKGWFGASGFGFNCYFIVALAAAFVVAGLTGLILERGIIRFLYKRPLESLLATWGVSLVLQQLFRHIFGAANVQVGSPSWLSGSFVIKDVLLAYNRLFVIAFAGGIVAGTYLLLTRTSLGLQIRAVMQNRAMASCLGVRTDRVNMMTFAFGSGLAGMAGACLSQIGNVGPSLGQNYIVDCFMVVVLGGVGNLVGTVSAAFGVGVTDQILQPWLGAVMGKITVLAAIILFLQWRPAGLFAARGRSLEG